MDKHSVQEYYTEMMKCFILLLLYTAGGLANEDKTLGMSEANPASSCHHIYTGIILPVGELLTSTG